MGRYSTAKQYITRTLGRKDDVGTHALASLSAGTVATTICAPADVLKSRIQSATSIRSGRAVSDTAYCSLVEELLLTEAVPLPDYSIQYSGGRTEIPHERMDAGMAEVNVSIASNAIAVYRMNQD